MFRYHAQEKFSNKRFFDERILLEFSNKHQSKFHIALKTCMKQQYNNDSVTVTLTKKKEKMPAKSNRVSNSMWFQDPKRLVPSVSKLNGN
ncbi:CLUMA_CG002894, isoform A [Clunio marinus]|uniref:CLUMA_CG002894, isoform A n=1 Tax=Clunio marinus TaxID=568069 RepID=A0A1J1HM65_9DIPT|nr:CLUMA_CG002894, isoform A [Clunio marinus]